MRYNRYYGSSEDLKHENAGKTAVLLVNLGTPEAPTAKGLRPYLRQFLSDPRVIEIPPLLWQFILNCFILTFRPKKSAALYKKIWTRNGSPLLLHTQVQARALQKILKHRHGDDIIVEAGMRLGEPSLKNVLEKLRQRGMTRLLVIPMYPQYSGTTTASVFDDLTKVLQDWRWIPELRIVNEFHEHPLYIDALVQSIHQSFEKRGKPDKLVLSFHGIPQRYVDNGDPYYRQCIRTGERVIEALGDDGKRVEVTFQSLFGKEEWIKPYTDERLEEFPTEGVKHVQAMCPGFTADCLETVDEINRESREVFMEAGGEEYHFITCVNAKPAFIECLADVCENHLLGWHSREATHRSEEKIKQAG